MRSSPGPQPFNLLSRLIDRERFAGRPGTRVAQQRQLYENVPPSKHSVKDVKGCDTHICRFTADGKYLVGFSKHLKDIVVYRLRGLQYSRPAPSQDVDGSIDDDDEAQLPEEAQQFSNHFAEAFRTEIALGVETICKDFCLVVKNDQYLLVASSAASQQQQRPGYQDCPVVPLDSITIHLVRLSDGQVTDRRVFTNDYIHLTHQCTGVIATLGLVAVLSILKQTIYMYQVTDEGLLIDIRSIGEHCFEDDELIIQSAEEAEKRWQAEAGAQQSFARQEGHGYERIGAIASQIFNHQASASRSLGNTAIQGSARTASYGGGAASEASANPVQHSMLGVANVSNSHRSPVNLSAGQESTLPEVALRGPLFRRQQQPEVSRVRTVNSVGAVRRRGDEDDDESSDEEMAERERQRQIRRIEQNVQRTAGAGVASQRMNHGSGALDAVSESASISLEPQGYRHHGVGIVDRMSESGAQGLEMHNADVRNPVQHIHASASGGLPMRSGRGRVLSAGERSLLRQTEEAAAVTQAGEIGNRAERRQSEDSGDDDDDEMMDRRQRVRQRREQQQNLAARQDDSIMGLGRHQQMTNGNPQHAPAPTGTHSQQLDHQHPQSSAPRQQELMNNFRSRVSGRPEISAGGMRLQQPPSRGPLPRPRHSIQDQQQQQLIPSAETLRNGMNPGIQATQGGVLHPSRLRQHRLPPMADHPTENRTVQANSESQATGPRASAATQGATGGLATAAEDSDTQQWQPPNRSGLLRGITQRILTHIFLRTASNLTSMEKGLQSDETLRFFSLFREYSDLLIWKIKILDRSHMLLLLGSPDSALLRETEDTQPSSFLVIYNFNTTEVVGLFPNHSTIFLKHYMNFHEHFLHGSTDGSIWPRMMASPSNSYFAREAMEAKLRTATQFRGAVQAAKHILAEMPFQGQAMTSSPYLDSAMFNYDHQLISATHRPRPCPDQPIRFTSRQHPDACTFRIDPGPLLPNATRATRGRVERLCSFLFHPYLPLVVLYIQNLMRPATISIYFR